MARILFIGVNYFGYTRRIVEEMVVQGHHVSYHMIEPADIVSKIKKRYLVDDFSKVLHRHHHNIIRAESDNEYDIVLFLQIHQIELSLVRRLREEHDKAQFILYNWDSLRTHDYRPWISLLDRVITFDPEDAVNLSIDYQPLFALPEYSSSQRDEKKEFDLYCVGSASTPARVRALAALKDYCRAQNLRLKMHLYTSFATMVSHLRRGLWLREFTTRTLDQAQIISMMEKARGVADFANHSQSGYTMRFIENMCAGVKIVTSNRRVLSEDFYAPDRFLVVDFDRLQGVPEFLDEPITSNPDFQEFSLKRWVERLLAAPR